MRGSIRLRVSWALRMGNWVAVLLMATSACGTTRSTTPLPTSPVDEVRVQITRIVDGDTFDIVFQDGSTDRVRLLGFDTPLGPFTMRMQTAYASESPGSR